jgi:hypothetical protein
MVLGGNGLNVFPRGSATPHAMSDGGRERSETKEVRSVVSGVEIT